MPKNIALKIYFAAFTATALLLLAFIYLNHHFDGSVWNGMKISKSALTGEYCELNNTTAFFHQRINTYSNLGYFFLGMIAILTSLYDRKNKSEIKNLPEQFPLLSFFFGICLVYLCFGSAFFHASLTWPGQRFDMNGIYSVCIALTGIGIYRMRAKNLSNLSSLLIIILMIVLVIVFVQLHLMISSFVLLPLIILFIIALTLINYLRNKRRFEITYALLSLVLLLVAFGIRTLDVMKVACDPLSFYQGHAIWHLLTGMSAFLLYWFYRSEQATS